MKSKYDDVNVLWLASVYDVNRKDIQAMNMNVSGLIGDAIERLENGDVTGAMALLVDARTVSRSAVIRGDDRPNI